MDLGTNATDEFAIRLVAQAHSEHDARNHPGPNDQTNFFRSADWSPDGTCLVTNSADSHIRTFIVPPELLDPQEQILCLQPYSAIPSREPADGVICYPGFSLESSSTALVLSAVNEHPIRLNSALTGELVASYPLISPTTEAYIKPQSMTFTANGSHFITGSQRLISTFDLSRVGSGPLSSLKTGPRRSKSTWSNPGIALGGLIGALAIDNNHNVLAAGTLSREIGLYDHGGQAECVGVFSVVGTDADNAISGNGVTHLAWSNCGRYLYITERKSDGAMIYDIRKSGQLLSWITGRAAMTNQRMSVQLVSRAGSNSHDLWAGCQDGSVKRWIEPHLQEGAVVPAEKLEVHKDLVNSVSMHQTADVLVTAAGQRSPHISEQRAKPLEKSLSSHDSTLKIWHMRSDTQPYAHHSPNHLTGHG